MVNKLNVGIIGATGAVGQNYALLLQNHPWFNINYLAASPNSAGKPFGDVAGKRWFMDRELPPGLVDLIVGDASKPEQALGKCDFVFSSYEGSKEEIQLTELTYAKLGIPVVSNNSAHRWTEDIPMIIPEINSFHAQIIPIQKRNRGFDRGFVVTKPNCSIQSFLTPVYALMQHDYFPRELDVVTMQAVSGAGYPGVASLDVIDNLVPYISGENDKTEKEPLKILGDIREGKIIPVSAEGLKIRARCTRVPVIDGHTACVTMTFDTSIKGYCYPSEDRIKRIWIGFESHIRRLNLPSAPNPVIIYRKEENRPQPRKDRMSGKGMAITVGGLKDYGDRISFVGLSHNTIRGAAGGAILTAELLNAEGYFD